MSKTIRTVGVVGAGTMGRGIVQVFAQAGHTVYCFDATDGAAPAAIEFVAGMLDRAATKGRMSAADAAAATASCHAAASMDDLSDCDLVIEAIIEDMGIKQKVFSALEAVVSDTAILASNTSSLTVSDIASVCVHPERVAGLHFFNPVPLMKVAEVIAAVKTSAATVEALQAVIADAGHRPVVALDQPGFLVNHAGRGLYTEGLRILEEQVASAQDVDTLMREALGFRMGPFELMDLTGLDVSGKVMESIYEQFHQEPRFRPSTLVPPRIAGGLYGRKTGEGWYAYPDGKKQEAPRAAAPSVPASLQIWIDPAAEQRSGLTELAQAAGAAVTEDAAVADLLLIQPWGSDATSVCVAKGWDASRCVAVDPLPGLDKHRTLMLTAVTTTAARDAAQAVLGADGTPVTVINDSPGFVTQRILATIVNIATNIAQRGIASVDDIEDAVRLGLGYPQGPLSLGDAAGGPRVHQILMTMLEQTGDPRYRPSGWLSRRVALGCSLKTAEAARA